ncbi:MAG: UDP-N-acetylmuramate--L-alanine ligase [Planctomycetota bacterium]
MSKYHFIGVGGSGMSGIAQVMRGKGHVVTGSDRNMDNNRSAWLYDKLRAQGIGLFPQDGSGVDEKTNHVIASTAIEDTNPDIAAAKQRNVPIMKRADLLAELVNGKRSVAIGGSSGKTTSTAMTAWVLERGGLDPTVMNGGIIKNYVSDTLIGNAKGGASDVVCVEADESDGTIVNYEPEVGIVTNVSKDHKEINELVDLFRIFAGHTNRVLILNADCPILREAKIEHDSILTFGMDGGADFRASDIKCDGFSASFRVHEQEYHLNLAGAHNVENALVAIAAGAQMGVAPVLIADALEEFKGVGRRMDLIGEARGVKVIDDFAHNPAKICAALSTVKPFAKRVLAVYQPHGFGPTKFLRTEFVEAFAEQLRHDDILYMPKIYYAGGTADKSISSDDIVGNIAARGRNAVSIPERLDLTHTLAAEAKEGDVIIVMGARDDTLTDFCRDILCALGG